MGKNEIWVEIDGCRGNYLVSNQGRIYSMICKRILKQQTAHHGYKRIRLYTKDGMKNFAIHRLVASAFMPNPDGLPEVNHRNMITGDNRVENLEWCSREYNLTYNGGPQKGKTPVAMLDKNGSVLRVFESQLAASKATGIGQGAISNACCGRANTAGNFRWQTIDQGDETHGR